MLLDFFKDGTRTVFCLKLIIPHYWGKTLLITVPVPSELGFPHWEQALFQAPCELQASFPLMLLDGSLPSFESSRMCVLVSTLLNTWEELSPDLWSFTPCCPLLCRTSSCGLCHFGLLRRSTSTQEVRGALTGSSCLGLWPGHFLEVVSWDCGHSFSVLQKRLFLADAVVSYQISFHIFRLFLVIVLDGRVNLVPVAPSCLEKEVLPFFFF